MSKGRGFVKSEWGEKIWFINASEVRKIKNYVVCFCACMVKVRWNYDEVKWEITN